MDIPFSTYVGGLKQINTDFNTPISKAFFETTFGEFNDLHEVYQKLKEGGTNYIISAAGAQLVTGVRPRRFAGGVNLPSGRYYAVCSPEDFNDHGTLRDEMYGYYSRESGINPLIFDPKVDVWLTDHLINNHYFTREEMEYPYFAIYCTFIKETEKNKLIDSKFLPRVRGNTVLVTYGIRELTVEIPNVIDLRQPETQEWFTATFVKMEKEDEKEAARRTGFHFFKGDGPQNFGELLPVISSLETGGGNIFGQAIGVWLRTNHVSGLIFPSARSTCENIVKNGKLVSSKGWNFVKYAGAPPPEENNLFGQMSTWKDPDHDHIRVKYESSGESKGSFSVRGVKEWNLLKFNNDKFVSYNDIKNTEFADLTGITNERITELTNAYLEQQDKNGLLWYNDIDSTHFIDWYEKLWIDKI